MLNISGEDVKLWLDPHEGNNGTWYTYSISVSRKDQEGKYHNKSVKVIFGKDVYLPNNLKSGDLFSFEGFPSIDYYEGKDGKEVRNLSIFVQKAKFNFDDMVESVQADAPTDTWTEAEEGIPFGG